MSADEELAKEAALMIESSLELIEDVRKIRKAIQEGRAFDSLSAPFYVKNRYQYWRRCKELLASLDRLRERSVTVDGWDEARFERNNERLVPQLGGWKLGSDESLGTMAASLRSVRE